MEACGDGLLTYCSHGAFDPEWNRAQNSIRCCQKNLKNDLSKSREFSKLSSIIMIPKKTIVPALFGFAAATLLSGCLAFQVGGGTTTKAQSATVGQQLVDLQTAKAAGAITEAEFQAQKAKILQGK
jgi:hypothetical protein